MDIINSINESFSIDILKGISVSRFGMDYELNEPFQYLTEEGGFNPSKDIKYILGTSSFEAINFCIDHSFKTYNFRIKEGLELVVYSILNRVLYENGIEGFESDINNWDCDKFMIDLDGSGRYSGFRLDVLRVDGSYQFDIVSFA